MLPGIGRAPTSAFEVHFSRSSRVGMWMLQSKTPCFLFKMMHVAWGPISTMQEILSVGRILVPPWFLGLRMTAIFLFSSNQPPPWEALSLTPMLLLELIELLKAFMFRFPCSFPGSEMKNCFHALVRLILLLFLLSLKSRRTKGVASIRYRRKGMEQPNSES